MTFANLGVRTAAKNSGARLSNRTASGASLRLGTALASGLVVVLTMPAARAQSMTSGLLLPNLDAVHGTMPATINPISVDGTTTATSLTVNLNNHSQVITWKSFDIGSGNTVSFSTADTSATNQYSVINRVVGDGTNLYKSEINGTINGQSNIAVWLINPSGITFGPGGAYSGGSLVLSTLDFSNETEAENFVDGNQQFVDVNGTGGKIDLSGGGIGVLSASGSTLLVAEDINVGKSINPASTPTNSSGAVTLALAHKVTFTHYFNDPLSFTIPVGTSLSVAAIAVTGTASVKGSTVKLVAASPAAMTAALLSTDSGTTLQATGVNGDVTLLLISDSNMALNNLTAKGTLTATGSVLVSASGKATVGGAVTADQQYSVSGASVTLGTDATEINQTSVYGTSITASTGDILGLGKLTVSTNVGNGAATKSVSLSTSGGQINFGSDTLLKGGSGSVKIGQPNNTSIVLGTVSANNFSTIFDSTVGIDGDFTAQSLDIANGVRLQVGGNVRLGSAKSVAGGSAVFIQAGQDVTGLAKANSGFSDPAFDRVNLDAPGAITVNTGGLAQLGTVNGASLTVNAGQTTSGGKIDLLFANATSGPVALTTYNASGTGNQDGKILVGTAKSNDTATIKAASSVRIDNLTATTGNLTIMSGGDLTGLSSDSATLIASAGAIDATASGKVQLGTVTAGPLAAGTDIRVSGTTVALTGDTTTGGALSLTATNGALTLGTASSGGDATLLAMGSGGTITLASLTSNQTSASLGTRVTADSSVRADTISSVNGPIAVTAQAGDLTGRALTLPATGFGKATVMAAAGAVTLRADTGVAQLGTVSAGGVNSDLLATSKATSADSASAGRDLTFTSTAGALSLGTGSGTAVSTAGRNALLTATGGELAVTTLNAGNAATLTGSTSVRARGVTTANGPIAITAMTGDVTGFAGDLPGVGGFGLAKLTATLGSVTVSAPNGTAQLGAVSAGPSNDVSVTAKAASATSASAGRDVIFSASNGALSLDSASATRDLTLTAAGPLTLGTGTSPTSTAGRDSTLTATGPNGTITVTSLTSGKMGALNGASVSASQDVLAGTITADTGGLTVTASNNATTGAITGLGGIASTPAGAAKLIAVAGPLTVNAKTIAQLDTAQAGSDVAITADAISVGTLIAGGNATLTARNGPLLLVSGTVTGSATLTKNGTSSADELRVGSLLAGSGLRAGSATLTSSTAIRASTITTTSGALTVNATTDISGFPTGAEGALPLVTTGTVLNANYAAPDLTAATTLQVTAIGGAQLGTLSGTNVSVQAAALTVQSANATGTLALTATKGTLYLGDATVTGNATLIKQQTDPVAALASAAGNELRLGGTLTAGSATLTSATGISANTVATTGLTAITATGGVLYGTVNYNTVKAAKLTVRADSTVTGTTTNTGNATIAADAASTDIVSKLGAIQLGTVTTTGTGQGITLNAGTDVSGIGTPTTAALSATGSVAITSGGATRLASVTTSGTGNITVSAGMAASNGAIAIGTVNAAGGVILDALANQAGGGAIDLGTVTAAGSITISNVLRDSGAGQGSITIGSAKSTGGDLVVDSARDLNFTTLLMANATVAARARGVLTGASAVGGEDVAMSAASISLDNATAGDDVALTATSGALSLGTAKTTGAGANTRVVAFTNRNQILFPAPDTLAGGSIDLKSGTALAVSGALSATGSISATSTGSTATLGNAVTAGRDYTVSAAGNVMLGGASATSQSAKGAVRVTSTGGSIGQGAGALTLTSNSDGVGTEALTLSAATGIALDTMPGTGISMVSGGTALRESAIVASTTAGGIALGTVSGASLAATSAAGFTASGPITVGSGTIADPDVMNGPSTLSINAGSGAITTQAITVAGSDHDARLRTDGAIKTGAISVARSLFVTGAFSFEAPSLTTTSGSATIVAGSPTTIANAFTISGQTNVATDFTVSAGNGAILLGTVTTDSKLNLGGGSVTVTGSASSGNTVASGTTTTIQASGAVNFTAPQTPGTPLSEVSRSRGATLILADTLTATGAVDADTAITVNTKGATDVGSTAAGTALSLTGNGITVRGLAMSGTTTTLNGGAISLGSAIAKSTFTATGSALTVTGALASGPAPAEGSPPVSGNTTTINTTGATTLGSALSHGATQITAGSLTVTGALASDTAITSFTSGATMLGSTSAGTSLALTGDTVSIGGTATANSSSLTLTGNAITVGGAASSRTTSTLTGGTIKLASITAGTTLTASGSAITVTGAANSGAPDDTDTSTTLTSTGAISLGSTQSAGATKINAGSLTVVGALNADTSIIVRSADTISLGSTTATKATLDLGGKSINVTGAATSGTSTTLNGTTISLGSVMAGSTLTTTGGTLTVAGAAMSGATGATGTTTMITAQGAVSLGSSLSRGATLINAGSLAVAGALNSDSAITGFTSGATMLGSTSAGTSLALTGDTVSIGGTATANSSSLTLTGNAITVGGAATSGTSATLTGGTIALGSVMAGTTLTANGSSISVTGAATSGALGASGTTTALTATGAISLGSSNSRGATQISAASLAVTGGLNADTAITSTTSGATTLGSTKAVTSLTLTASPLTVNGLAQSGTATTLAGGAVALGAATAGTTFTAVNATNLTVTGALTSGTVPATGTTTLIKALGVVTLGSALSHGATDIKAGALTVTGALASDTAIKTTTGGATSLGSSSSLGATQIDAGSLMVTGALIAGTSITSTTGGATTLGSTSAGTTLTLTAGTMTTGPLTVNGSAQSGGAMALAGSAITVSGPTTAGTTLAATTATGDLTLVGATNAAGAVTLDVRGVAKLNAVTTPAAVTLTASDAVLGGTIGASIITINDRSTADNPLQLGDNIAVPGGFALISSEVNLLAAPSVVFNAGTVSGPRLQNVAIGDLPITNTTITSLVVNALQRIDITGALSSASTKLTALRLGGVASSSTTTPASQLATVLRIAAKADGSGGKINLANVVLDLQATTIGAGQDAGFLDVLGVKPGSNQTLSARTAVNSAASSLYNANSTFTPGGTAYVQTPTAPVLIAARMVNMTYSNFALVQNTAPSGSFGGVMIGTATPIALQLVGSGGVAGPFEMFGSINGNNDTSAALAAPTITPISIDRTTARFNGCLIGSGAGCLNTQITTPSLDAIDQSRTGLVLPNPDFKLPFNPLVGTNNDSLFGDVGSIGLGDLPIAAIDCPEGDKSCGPPKTSGAPIEKPEGKK